MHTIQPKVSAGWIVRYVLGLAGQPSSVGVLLGVGGTLVGQVY